MNSIAQTSSHSSPSLFQPLLEKKLRHSKISQLQQAIEEFHYELQFISDQHEKKALQQLILEKTRVLQKMLSNTAPTFTNKQSNNELVKRYQKTVYQAFTGH